VTTTEDAQTVAELARAGTEPHRIDPGSIYLVATADGDVQQFDLTGDAYRDTPRRKTGTTVVRDPDSFLAYWGKHSDPGSEVYADRQALTITAVLNAHTADSARFGDHRVVLRLRHSDSFEAWAAASGKDMNQTRFAEFVEDHRTDIRTPPAADLLELAQTFQATTKVSFKSGSILKSGQRQLTYVEETDASAGRKGQLTIPDDFELGLAVFQGATEADAVTARLRYRISGEGRLALLFILDRLPEVVDAAFEGVVAAVAAGVAVPILRGTPA
jgi:uncharacterized protein YfdQ (DUF2303 family)